MKCKYCGAENPNNASYCYNCRRSLKKQGDKQPNNQQSKNKNTMTILLVVILSLVVVLIGIIFAYLFKQENTAGSMGFGGGGGGGIVDFNDINPTKAPEVTLAPTVSPTPEITLAPTLVPTSEPNPTQKPSERPEPDDDDYLFNSDTEYITNAFLDKQTREQVRLILNEIYARHGYIFTEYPEYQDYFSKKSWYRARTSNMDEIEQYFNDYERENRNIIVNYEKSKGWR